jgi:ornithine decarboxylase
MLARARPALRARPCALVGRSTSTRGSLFFFSTQSHAAPPAWSPVPAILENIRKDDLSDAFYVVNLAQVVRQHNRWLKELPRVAPYYAVKCNNDPVVLQTLANLGCGFDCASPAEINQLRALKVAPERLIYANPCKQPSHMQSAREAGVNFTVFDSKEELFKIKKSMPEARLMLRLRPDDSHSVCRFGMKYGAELWEVAPLLRTAAELGLSVGGISFHVGSGCYAPESFADAVEMAADAFQIAQTEGFEFSLLDIGGGFPGEVVNATTPAAEEPNGAGAPDQVAGAGQQLVASPSFEQAPPTFEAICAALRPALDRHFPPSSGVRLLAEPGRYYVHASHTLAAQVIGRKVLDPSAVPEGVPASPYGDDDGHGDATRYKYYINDGIYGSFNCLLYDHAHVTPNVLPAPAEVSSSSSTTMRQPQQHPSSVWGPTCDGLDCVLNSTMLPELQVGDWLYFEHMGAYTVAAASSFNGFAPPSAQYVYDDMLMDEEAPAGRQHKARTVTETNQNVLPHVRLVGDTLGNPYSGYCGLSSVGA